MGPVNQGDFETALSLIGYRKCEPLEWRRQRFHLILRVNKRGTMFVIHEDVPTAFPPFHRAATQGKALKVETQKIRDAYKKIRDHKRGPKPLTPKSLSSAS